MSGAGRKRNSKWDFKQDSQHPIGRPRENNLPGKESDPGRSYNEGNGRNGSRRSVREGDDQLKSDLDMRTHSKESWLISRNQHHGDGEMNHVKNFKSTTECERGGSSDNRKSSKHDDYRQPNFGQSPRRDWQRSHRSRSTSRSRSRSRSPLHGVKRESGSYDRSKSRLRVSPQSGKDFSDSSYRRGSDEHVWITRNRKLRDSEYGSIDDSREQTMRSGRSAEFGNAFLEHNSRRETSGSYLHDDTSDGVARRSRHEPIRERENSRRADTLVENNCEGGPRRNFDIPCKFFAAGNCRSGKNCRFSHHGGGRGSPERKSHNDWFKRDHEQNDLNKSWNGPKWTGTEKAHAGKYSEVETASASTSVEPKANEKWLDDMEMSPDWNVGVQTLNNNLKDENGQNALTSQSLSLNNASAPSYDHGRADEASWRHEIVRTPHQLVTDCYSQPGSKHGGATTFSFNEKNAIKKPLGSQLDPNDASDIIPVQAHNQNDGTLGVLPYPTSFTTGKSQVSTGTDLSRGLGTNNHENGAVFHEKNSKNKPDVINSDQSQVNYTTPTQSTVTREQLSQITHLSATLAQFFGNGQQLPPHNSSLISQNAEQVSSLTTSEGNVKPDSSTIFQPNQSLAFQTRHDPTSDCVGPEQHDYGIKTERLPVSTTAWMSTTEVKPERPPDNLTSSALLNASSEKERTDGSNSLSPSEPVENPKVSEEKSKALTAEEFSKAKDDKKITQQSGDAENADGDGRDDEDKKAKEPKGMRAFKFALVDIVKELLKPSWKEGRMSKDAYKSIVKKVVDKVSGTMQGANVPQTQEKIDHYLSASKPKLAKLIQAYVNKYQKS